jgi:hypothetical protein
MLHASKAALRYLTCSHLDSFSAKSSLPTGYGRHCSLKSVLCLPPGISPRHHPTQARIIIISRLLVGIIVTFIDGVISHSSTGTIPAQPWRTWTGRSSPLPPSARPHRGLGTLVSTERQLGPVHLTGGMQNRALPLCGERVPVNNHPTTYLCRLVSARRHIYTILLCRLGSSHEPAPSCPTRRNLVGAVFSLGEPLWALALHGGKTPYGAIMLRRLGWNRPPTS